MVAAEGGEEDRVRTLLESGAAVNDQDIFSMTALTRAAIQGHCACAELLIQAGADVNIPDSNKLHPAPTLSSGRQGDGFQPSAKSRS